MLKQIRDYWDNLHRHGANFLEGLLSWLPFSDNLTDVVVSNFIFTDISEEKKQSFRKFYENTLIELLHFWLWWHAFVLILSWPLEFFLFGEDLIITYAIWRCLQLLLIVAVLFDFNAWGFLKTKITVTYFLLTSSVIVITGISFGSTVSLTSPWFNVVYALPFLCLPVDLKLFSRIIAAFFFPFLYMGAFVIFYPERWNLVLLRNTSFLLFYASILAGFITHLFFSLFKNSYFVQQELEDERRRSEELLLNILPEDVAGELKSSNRMIADGYDEATVLFADLVEFTPLAEELNPSSVVTLLDDIMSSFDRIVDHFPVEKIKTVGDEYFLIAGVPREIDNHATVTAEVALEMRNEIQNYSRNSNDQFNVRIGLNSGPVVAGVIGTDKFVFDCWGATVNVGSRMESQGKPGKIQVTPSTREAILKQDEELKFKFEERGEIAVKGKGKMSTYFLERNQ